MQLGLHKGSRKKSSSLNGWAIKRGGGGKGPAIKEKITFFLNFVAIFKKKYFTWDNFIPLKYALSVGIFTWLLQYFPKNRAILVQKLGVEIFLSKSVSSYLKTKTKTKVPMAN